MLYKYIKGKTPLGHEGHREAIFTELRLTPEERTDLMEALEISRSGRVRFLRRQKVHEILKSLLTLEASPPMGRGDSVEGSDCPQETALDTFLPGFINGETPVRELACAIFRWAFENGGALLLMVQPEADFLESLFMLAGQANGSCRVTQLICFDSDGSGPMDGCGNLERIRRVLRFGISVPAYTPMYFYGSAAEHYGVMNLFPGLIISDICAVQLSGDFKCALYHRSPDAVAFFRETFLKISSYCSVLMYSLKGMEGLSSWWASSMVTEEYENGIEMSCGLCPVPFWDERLIREYINPALSKSLVPLLCAYCSGLYAAKRQGGTTVLMNPAGALDFIKTGIIREYPSIFFHKPISPKDRRLIIERILSACDEGWYHIHFVKKNFPLDGRWEVVSHLSGRLFLQYMTDENFYLFEIQEPDTREAFYDYLENLCTANGTASQEETQSMLREWLDVYCVQKTGGGG